MGPMRNTATPSTHSEGATRASAQATASSPPAATSARRSPIRSTSTPAGTAAANSDSVAMPTNRAARPTEAPRLRALRATTGSTAPAPIDQIAEGPKAGTAIRRSENSSCSPTPTSSTFPSDAGTFTRAPERFPCPVKVPVRGAGAGHLS